MYSILPIIHSCYKVLSTKIFSVISSKTHKMSECEEYVEDIVCKVSELIENIPKVFPLGEGKVLLIKQNGKINAIGNKCTHYGAPLENSAVGDGRIRCQWHGACFNIETGDIEDFPGETFQFQLFPNSTVYKNLAYLLNNQQVKV